MTQTRWTAAPGLSVVIPAYNEATRISGTLSAIVLHLENRGEDFEVLVADDGSADQTAEIVERFGDPRVGCLRAEKNAGKGAAVRRGLQAAIGARVLITDADLSTPIEDLQKLEPHLKSAQLVIGSRAHPDSVIADRQPIVRESLGKAFNAAVGGLGLVPRQFTDTQCGFKLLDGEAASALAPMLTIDGFAYDVELIALALGCGYQVVDVGVRWTHREPSSVPLFAAGARMVVDVLRLRLSSRRHGREGVDLRFGGPWRRGQDNSAGESTSGSRRYRGS